MEIEELAYKYYVECLNKEAQRVVSLKGRESIEIAMKSSNDEMAMDSGNNELLNNSSSGVLLMNSSSDELLMDSNLA